ncbi:MAG: hypothetical protein ACPL2E_07590 [Conexivisphaera sp.]
MPQEPQKDGLRLSGVLVFSEALDLGGKVDGLTKMVASIVEHNGRNKLSEVAWCSGGAEKSPVENEKIAKITLGQGYLVANLAYLAYLDELARELFKKSFKDLTGGEKKRVSSRSCSEGPDLRSNTRGRRIKPVGTIPKGGQVLQGQAAQPLG